ncbi:MAG: hypothetical protein IPP90_21155 [Gemmatimonadaceae bacterium]|nr:hypothetical protein [Gemmatimonadaceae bacterium]
MPLNPNFITRRLRVPPVRCCSLRRRLSLQLARAAQSTKPPAVKSTRAKTTAATEETPNQQDAAR